MLKKKILVCAVSASILLGVSTSANAFVVMDVVTTGQKIIEEVLRKSEAMAEVVLEKYAQAQETVSSKFKISTFNNGAANAISRKNQNATDIQNLEQVSRARSNAGACDTIHIGGSLSDALCGSAAVTDAVKDGRSVYTQISKPTSSGGSGSDLRLNDIDMAGAKAVEIGGSRVSPAGSNAPKSAATSEATQADVYNAFVNKTIEHVINIGSHIDAGRGDDAKSADLTIPYEGTTSEFSPEQLDIAMSNFFIEHPPYVFKSLNPPENDSAYLAEESKKVRQEIANAVFAKGISLKSKTEGQVVSKLFGLEIASTIRLVDSENKYDADAMSFIEELQSSELTPGSISREDASMMAINLSNQFEKYKQLLDIEFQLANYALMNLEDYPLSELKK